jgi:hypothetical protein
MKYRCKYEYQRQFGNPLHIWSLVGARGGIHVHITVYSAEFSKKYGQGYSGGIEVHYRNPPKALADQPPSHDECQLLKCPCWHDGSSLQAEEYWIPLWIAAPNDHDGMFRLLERTADKVFADDNDDAEDSP